MEAQILGHTQQGVQGMLCTKRRAVLLPLVIYMDGELFESRHVLENEVATVDTVSAKESISVERGTR